MDPNANALNSDSKHHDIAEPGPIDPLTGQPDHHAEVSAVKSWLRENAFSLVISAVAVVLVYLFWDPLTAAKVVLGLGFIIFIHELGHFLAAKWCDVHVKTFSIGFGPAVPFCSYKWGETTYMLGVIPLGGYVSMVGEGTGESTPDGDPDDDDSDPRSFKNKGVGQRMLIISAGVIMNVILGMACFMAAYLHGVKEEPAVAGSLFSGGAAWRGGVRSGDDIVKIGSRDNPSFKDLRPVVMSSSKGEQVPLVVDRRGTRIELDVEPLRDEGTYFPQLGITTIPRLTLLDVKKPKVLKPVVSGSKAADAKDPAFEPGDRIVAMTDPADPATVTTLPRDKTDRADFNEYHRRMVLLADRPVTFHVLRKNDTDGAKPVPIPVQPAFRASLGLRMKMGKVAAIRRGGPAEKAGVQPVSMDAPPNSQGDTLVEVRVTDASGKRLWFVTDAKRPADAKPDDAVQPLDPILLPRELDRWAAGFPENARKGLKVELVVLREVDHREQPQLLTLDYDDSFRFEREVLPLANSPLALDGLGLAYWVTGVVAEVEPGSPAAAAGVQANDTVAAVKLKALDDTGTLKAGDWEDIKPHQWAWAESMFQGRPPHEIELKLTRGEEVLEKTLNGRPDPKWPVDDRGLVMQAEYRIQEAADVGDAIRLGALRTVRFVKEVYMNLYAMVRGRVSAKTMSGPLTIANVSYKIAGEDFWQYLLFLGMISVNLAVVNFLPVPVLDGGHMVFLIYEKVTGRPVPERLFAAAMWIGLALILLLFVFVITLDIRRLFFGLI